MYNTVSPEVKELVKAVHYRPAVSIIMPFEPAMIAESELMYSFKMVKNKVERELEINYPADIVAPIMSKLSKCIRELNFHCHKKSIAIFISPVFEKVLYLEIPVEEKIIIDESFEIRDLVYCKKELHKYLVLLFSSNAGKIFLGNTETFVRIVSNTPDSIYDAPERISNFSDMAARREIAMGKFIYQVDKTLDIILKAYDLPLYVMGNERIAGHFKSITKHSTSIIDYVYGNYEEASIPEIRKVLEPYITDWKLVKQKEINNLLEDAAGRKKLVTGIQEVWKQATNKRGKLLVVEKNYMYAAEHSAHPDEIYKEPAANKFSVIVDAVDDIIEKVLDSGGDVEFVEENFLKSYGRIALIQYY